MIDDGWWKYKWLWTADAREREKEGDALALLFLDLTRSLIPGSLVALEMRDYLKKSNKFAY